MTEMLVKQGNNLNPVREMLEEAAVGEMSILGERGDMKVAWNARDTDEVNAARAQFVELTQRGFRAFEVTGEGGTGEQMEGFDPEAQKIILVPPVAGGSDAMRDDPQVLALEDRAVEIMRGLVRSHNFTADDLEGIVSRALEE